MDSHATNQANPFADLPAAVAALPIEIRANGDRLIVHTDVCKLLGVSAAGLRRLVERKILTRADAVGNKSYYRAEDIGAEWMRRNPGADKSAPRVTPSATSHATDITPVAQSPTQIEDIMSGLRDVVRDHMSSQSRSMEALTAANLSMAGTIAAQQDRIAQLERENAQLKEPPALPAPPEPTPQPSNWWSRIRGK